jgi:hypothetical protein
MPTVLHDPKLLAEFVARSSETIVESLAVGTVVTWEALTFSFATNDFLVFIRGIGILRVGPDVRVLGFLRRLGHSGGNPPLRFRRISSGGACLLQIIHESFARSIAHPGR